MTEISPCPFCGGDGRLTSVDLPMAYDCADVYVSCGDCDAIGPTILVNQDYHTADDVPDLEAEAIAAWNKRAY